MEASLVNIFAGIVATVICVVIATYTKSKKPLLEFGSIVVLTIKLLA